MDLLDDYLTREELAAQLRVTPRTIARWQDQPDGLPHLKIGDRVYYRRKSVAAWIENQEVKPNPRRKAAAQAGG